MLEITLPGWNSAQLLLEMLFCCISGILCGAVTGVTPGVHLNLVSVIAASLFPAWFVSLGLHSPILLVFVFVMSVGVTHTICDGLASTYLGVPNEDSVASMLPAQQLVVAGKAHTAVFFVTLGSVCSAFATLPLIALLAGFLPWMQDKLTPFLWIVLLLVILILLWREKNRILCICLLLASGGLGTIVLALPSMHQPLLPLLSGLFGGAGLFEIIRNNISIPSQEQLNVGGRIKFLPIIVAAVTGVLAAFLPGIGSSQAGILAGKAMKDRDVHAQLIVAGGINTVNMIFSIVTWAMLDKSRNGAVAALAGIGDVNASIAILLVLICCVVVPVGGLITLSCSRSICRLFVRINYRILAISILAFVIGLTCYFDSYMGALIFIAAMSLGLLCQVAGTPKHYLMGCLLIQVLVFFMQ